MVPVALAAAAADGGPLEGPSKGMLCSDGGTAGDFMALEVFFLRVFLEALEVFAALSAWYSSCRRAKIDDSITPDVWQQISRLDAKRLK